MLNAAEEAGFELPSHTPRENRDWGLAYLDEAPPETAIGRFADSRFSDRLENAGYFQMGVAPFTAMTGFTDLGTSAVGGGLGAVQASNKPIARALDRMIAQGRYANLPGLHAMREVMRGPYGHTPRAAIALHSALQEDPDFRQAFNSAMQEEEPSAGTGDDQYRMSSDELDALLGDSSKGNEGLRMTTEDLDALGR